MKKYGIKVSMPGGDTLSAAHLLGDAWESFRWFDDEQQRDQALADMQRQPVYYRKGDSPSVVLQSVESEHDVTGQ